MNVNELIAFLKSVDAKPKKGLSQNFLIDPPAIEKIVKTAEVKTGDAVLEIGPGPGALTSALLNAGARVFAVEIDPVFAQALERFQNGKLRVFQADFLKFPMQHLPSPLKIVANLPYHITTPILERIFGSSFLSMTIMVQKEVADRMLAKAGSKTFGSLSIFTQFYTNLHSSFIVPANSFYPMPTVDSMVIRLDHRTPPDVDPVQFFALVHKAFQQRRKMITSSLDLPKDDVRNALISLGANPQARPEELSLEIWVEFAKIAKNFKAT